MSLEFDIRKLEPKRGDTIIVRYPTDLDQKQVTKIFHVCGLMMDQTGVLVVAVPKSIDITVDSNYLKAAQPHMPRVINNPPVNVGGYQPVESGIVPKPPQGGSVATKGKK